MQTQHCQLATLTTKLNFILDPAFVFAKLEGKMKLYLILSFICYFYQSTSMKIKPELKKNILNIGYRINYKYEGMLAHSFDRFYVITKFILPSIGELKFQNLIMIIHVCTWISKMLIILKQENIC